MLKDVFFAISAIVTILSIVPYILGIVKQKVRPNVTTWLIWTILSLIAMSAQFVGHAYLAAAYSLALSIRTGVVVILGFRHGYIKFSRFDVACLVAAAVGIILWQIFKSPTVGVVATVVVSLVGAVPTLVHSWQKPHEETWKTFVIGTIGSMFSVASLQSYTWISLPFPAYVLSSNLAIALTIIFRGRMSKNKQTKKTNITSSL